MKNAILGLLSLAMIVATFVIVIGKAGNTLQAQRDCTREYQLEGLTKHEAQQECALRKDIWE